VLDSACLAPDLHHFDVELDDALQHRGALFFGRRLRGPLPNRTLVNARFGAKLACPRGCGKVLEPFEDVLERLLDDRETSRLAGRHS